MRLDSVQSLYGITTFLNCVDCLTSARPRSSPFLFLYYRHLRDGRAPPQPLWNSSQGMTGAIPAPYTNTTRGGHL